MKVSWIVAGLVLLIGVFACGWLYGRLDEYPALVESGSRPEVEHLRIVESSLRIIPGADSCAQVVVTGRIRNDGAQSLYHCGLEVRIDDANGDLLDVLHGSARRVHSQGETEFSIKADALWAEQAYASHDVRIAGGR
ncbi:MAG: hypothetical protein AAF533_02175 [Acidobacteriota bacterium]